MGANSKIEWCHHTFNAWWGCVEVSPECDHCYARTWSKRTGFAVWGKDAERRFFSDKHWGQLAAWNHAAQKAGERHRVFWNSMSDILEDRRDLDEWRERAWGAMAATPSLEHLLLSKRPQNFTRLLPMESSPLPNVWCGATAGVRASLWRIEELRKVPARIRFVSAEPLLEDLGKLNLDGIHQVIIGGESGPEARPMSLRWARRIVKECAAAKISIFVKQLGAKPCAPSCSDLECTHPGCDSGWLRLADRKGGDMAEWPEDLRVREFPQ